MIRGAKEGERIAREILGPRLIKALEVGGEQVAKGYRIVKRYVRCICQLLSLQHQS